nr:uncharacterized protein LOC129388272 [Dermacentor andersoni]
MNFSLGSMHDGEPALPYIPKSPSVEACPDNGQYIMATIHPIPPLPPLSKCTRNQVLAYLKTDDAACLRNAQPRRSPQVFEALLRQPLLNASKYCNYLHKDAATVEYKPAYSYHYNIQKCILVCVTTNSVGAKEYNIHPAPDYTPCREMTKQVCIEGICRDIPSKGKPFHQQVKQLANRPPTSDIRSSAY